MVKIVTDSTSDIPPQIAENLGITVVPAYVNFGNMTYRDRVDISEDELYKRLIEGSVHPTTSTPSPGDFADAYKRLSQESSEIVCIILTSKESAIYEAALLGKERVGDLCQVEVIDSQSITMGLGFIAMAAAKAAQSGSNIEEVVKIVRQAISKTYLLGFLDTPKYALKGGRLGKAALVLGAMLRVKPILTLRNGDIALAGLTRTHSKAIERLYEFIKKHLPVDELAIVHSTTPKEAQSLAERVESLNIGNKPIIARLGPALGVHGGPGTLIVALREK